MNKAELVNTLAGRLGGNKKAAGEALNAVIDTVYRAVAKGEKVTITGFGSFERVQRGARTGRNPATGQTIPVKKSVAPKFRPGQEFKNVVSGSKKLPRLAAVKTATASGTARTSGSTTARKSAAAKTTKSAAAKTLAKKAPAASRTTKSAAAKTLAKKAPAASKTTKSTAAKTLAKKAPAASRTTKSAAAKTLAKKAATKSTTKRAAAKR